MVLTAQVSDNGKPLKHAQPDTIVPLGHHPCTKKSVPLDSLVQLTLLTRLPVQMDTTSQMPFKMLVSIVLLGSSVKANQSQSPPYVLLDITVL